MSENEDIKRVLVDARELLSGGWCIGSYEREIGGKRCYCAMGALEQACGGWIRPYPFQLAKNHLEGTLEAMGIKDMGLITYNDTTNQAAVLELFDRAISRLEG